MAKIYNLNEIIIFTETNVATESHVNNNDTASKVRVQSTSIITGKGNMIFNIFQLLHYFNAFLHNPTRVRCNNDKSILI